MYEETLQPKIPISSGFLCNAYWVSSWPTTGISIENYI